MDGQWIMRMVVPYLGDDDGPYVTSPRVSVVELEGESILGTLALGGLQTLDDTARIRLQFVSVTFEDAGGKVIRESYGSGVRAPANDLKVTIARNKVRQLEVERWGLDGRGTGSLNLCFWGNVY